MDIKYKTDNLYVLPLDTTEQQRREMLTCFFALEGAFPYKNSHLVFDYERNLYAAKKVNKTWNFIKIISLRDV
jgi:hypothetical protein